MKITKIYKESEPMSSEKDKVIIEMSAIEFTILKIHIKSSNSNFLKTNIEEAELKCESKWVK